MPKRVVVVGLDCVPPEFVFDLWNDRLPNFRRVMHAGIYGKLESCIPPITVPAWMCMMTGRDPGSLGIYGFRNRKDHSYDGLSFASSRIVKESALWEVLAESGRKTIALGVPLTYPPRPINGLLISDFLAPDTNSDYTFPTELKHEIRDVVGEYILDTRNFRTENKDQLLSDIYEMTAQRFQLAKYLMKNKPWEFFMMVEMGPDRLHHAFWKYFDPKHPKYEAGHPLEHAIRDYYISLDQELGSFISELDEDVTLMIVSDHGAKRMDGGFCFNQWLIQEGYLTLKSPCDSVTKFSPEIVDWEKTKAWGDGGYYGRLFLNIEGREPQGIIKANEVESLKRELQAKLESITNEEGLSLGSKVYRPERTYAATNRVPPDLIIYFGDLHWRSVGSIGHPSLWTHENDTGPDDANHAQHGIFLMADAAAIHQQPAETSYEIPQSNYREGLSIYDIAPTVLNLFGIVPPKGMGRTAINSISSVESDTPYSESEEEELARRLEDLGYL